MARDSMEKVIRNTAWKIGYGYSIEEIRNSLIHQWSEEEIFLIYQAAKILQS